MRLRLQFNFHQTPARWRSSLRCSSSFLWSTSPRLQTDGARIPSHPQICQHFLDFPPDLLGAGRGEQFCQLLTCLRSSRFRQELRCLLLRCKVQCVTAESAMRHNDQSKVTQNKILEPSDGVLLWLYGDSMARHPPHLHHPFPRITETDWAWTV